MSGEQADFAKNKDTPDTLDGSSSRTTAIGPRTPQPIVVAVHRDATQNGIQQIKCIGSERSDSAQGRERENALERVNKEPRH